MGQVNNNYSQTDYSARPEIPPYFPNLTIEERKNFSPVRIDTKFIQPNGNGEVQFWVSVRNNEGKEVLYKRTFLINSSEPLSFKDVQNILDYNQKLMPSAIYAKDNDGNLFQYQIGQGITDGRKNNPDSTSYPPAEINQSIEQFIKENEYLPSSVPLTEKLIPPPRQNQQPPRNNGRPQIASDNNFNQYM